MNTFKRNTVYAAVLAGLGAVGAVGTAEAVYVNPDGLGQVLVYPYYTVRGAKGSATQFYDTYATVVNSTSQIKAVKVRFMEGRRSQEVLDFNLFLSPNDAWVGAVSRTANGARLISGDRSCTLPAGVFSSAGSTVDQSTPNVFKNYAYTGSGALGNPYSGADGATGDLDRGREGHFEIVEMGVVTDTSLTASLIHNSAGTPANCAVIVSQFNANFLTSGTPTTSAQATGLSTVLAAPNGGLFGGATLINVLAGTDYSYDAVALEQVSGAQQYVAPGYPTPNLMTGQGGIASSATTLNRTAPAGTVNVLTETYTDAFTVTGAAPTGTVMIGLTLGAGQGVLGYPLPNVVSQTATPFGTFPFISSLGPLKAVSAVLQHDTIMNEYVLDTATSSATDWIVTFPTKGLSVGVQNAAFTSPFGQNFNNTGVGSCEPIGLTFFDREEQFTAVTGVSPLPSTASSTLCWETNVLAFGTTPANALGTLAGSTLNITVPTPYASGWAVVNLNTRLSAAGVTGPQNLFGGGMVNRRGLPVVGFSMQDFAGGTGAVSNYGGGFKHKYSTLIN